jgi:DNA-binding GntR family transcriptional regulator
MNGLKIQVVERELLSHKAANILRHMILTGELSPGTRLVEDELAGQLGISRAPLREALSFLTQEGLVNGQPGRGTFVKGLTEQNVHDFFAVRTVLEVFAAEQCARRIEPPELDRLQGLTERMEEIVSVRSVTDYVALDIAIHRLIWDLSRSERAAYFLDTLIQPLKTYIQINAESYSDWPYVIALHRHLVEALASHDSALAGKRMLEHMANATSKALSAFASFHTFGASTTGNPS